MQRHLVRIPSLWIFVAPLRGTHLLCWISLHDFGNENGKLNLSIKRLEAKPQQENKPRNNFRSNPAPSQNVQNRAPKAPTPPPAPKSADQLFEEKLKAFMSESDSTLSSIRADHRTKSRRR